MTQTASLREQLRTLEQLQELDLKIDGIIKNKDALPAALKALDDSLGRLKQTVAAKQNAITEIEKIQKQTHAALDLNKDRLARSTSRLESVQNSQEYSAVNKEIEQLNKMNLSLEEQNKKSITDIDTINKEISELTTQLEKIQGDRDTQDGVVTGQTSQLESQLSELNKERQTLATKVERKLLSQYDRVRNARNGLGIVPAVAGRCKGCNMVLPPQLFNQIQKGTEMYQCPSCFRILFFPTSQPDGSKSPEANPV